MCVLSLKHLSYRSAPFRLPLQLHCKRLTNTSTSLKRIKLFHLFDRYLSCNSAETLIGMGNGASGPANVQASNKLPVKPEQTFEDKPLNTTFLEIEDKQDVKRRKSNDLSAVIPQEYVEKGIKNAPSTPTTSSTVVAVATASNDMVKDSVEIFAEELDSFDAGPDLAYPLDGLISQRHVNSQQMDIPPKDFSAPPPALLPSPTTPVRLAITGAAKNPQQRDSTSPELLLSPSSSQHNSTLLRSSSQNPPPSSPSKAPIDTTTARDQLLEMNARMDALLVQAADIATVRSNAKANAKAAAAAKIAAQHQSRNLPSSSQSRIRSGESRRKSEVRARTPTADSEIPPKQSLSPKPDTSKSNTDVMDFLNQVEMKMRAKTIAQAPLSSLTPAEFAFTLEQRAQERAAQKQLEQARRQGELEAMRKQFEGETKRKEAELELLRQQIRNADAALHIEALKDEVKRIANTGTSAGTSPIIGMGTGAGVGTSPGTVSARAVVRIKAKPTGRATAVGVSTGNAIIGTGLGTDTGAGMGASMGTGVTSFSSRTSGTCDVGTGSHRGMGSALNSGKGMGMGLNTGTTAGMSSGKGTGTALDALDVLTAQHASPTTTRTPLPAYTTTLHTPSLSNYIPTRPTQTSVSADPYSPARAPLTAEGYRGHRGGSASVSITGSSRHGNSGDAGGGVGGSGISSLRARNVLASNAALTLTNNSQENAIGAHTHSTGMGTITGMGTDTSASPISTSSSMLPTNVNGVGGHGNDDGGAGPMTNVNAALRAKTQRGMFSFDTGVGKSNRPLPQVAELAVLEHALRQDLAEDKALDAQLRETSLRVAALEKAAAEKRAKKAMRQKMRERELEEL